MAQRTTFSLDSDTVAALHRLAELWDTSQAGVIRRAVRAAAESAQAQMTPRQALASLRAGAVPMDADELKLAIEQARQARIEADADRP